MSRLRLLDTNIYRSWVDGTHDRHDVVVRRVHDLGKAFAYLSVVTKAEVEFGLSRPHRLSAEVVQEIRHGLSQFRFLEIDHHVAEPYGRLRAWLTENYGPRHKRKRLSSFSQLTDPVTDIELGIQENDLWLASQAIAAEAVRQDLHFAKW